MHALPIAAATTALAAFILAHTQLSSSGAERAKPAQTGVSRIEAGGFPVRTIDLQFRAGLYDVHVVLSRGSLQDDERSTGLARQA